MPSNRLLAFLLPAALLLGTGLDTAAAEAGTLRGRVVLQGLDLHAGRSGPIVVFLERVDGRIEPATPRKGLKIEQHHASFLPDFLAIAAGESVDMPNDDVILHNVFSYSTPNDFDLGLYAQGDSRTVTFRYAGVVRIYCSIHESMSGTIFVAPSRLYALVDESGAFAIASVPSGRYRVRSWSRSLPRAQAEVEMPGSGDVRVDLVVEPGQSGR